MNYDHRRASHRRGFILQSEGSDMKARTCTKTMNSTARLLMNISPGAAPSPAKAAAFSNDAAAAATLVPHQSQ